MRFPGEAGASPGLVRVLCVTLRIALAEDSYIVREGIEQVLRGDSEIEVVASCGDMPSLLDAVAADPPDVVLTDIRMPPEGDDAGIQLTISRLGAKSITFRDRIFRAEPRELAADGSVVCAVVDLARFVAIPIPENVSEMLRDLVEVPG